MMQIEDYTVRIDAFQGPLDLLLYLIRRAEVDITDIPISGITEQFLEFLKDIERIDIDAAGEFLVMAATLMEIKSRLIAPVETSSNGDDPTSSAEIDPDVGLDRADPRYELVKQLLAYKRFRHAAHQLDRRRHEWDKRFPLTAARVGRPAESDDAASTTTTSSSDEFEDPDELEESPHSEQNAADLEDVSVWDLAQIFQRIIAAIDFGKMGDHHVQYDDTPIELHEEDLIDQLRRSADQRISLRVAFQGRSRIEAIGLFLATLELVRERRVVVKQDRINDDIVLLPAEGSVEEDESEPAEASPDALP